MDNLRKTAAFTSGELLWEYFLIIRKEDGPLTDLGKKPFITLARFQAKEAMEETLIRWIQNICRLQNSFCITITVKGNFLAGQIEIQDSKPLLQLANSLKIIDGFIQSNECPPLWVAGKAELSNSIHQPFLYEYLSVTSASSQMISFPVEKIQLVKREGVYGAIQLVNSFTLSMPVIQV